MKNCALSVLFSLVSLLVFSGCGSTVVNSHLQKAPMMEQYMAGQNPAVTQLIEKKLDKNSWRNVINTGDEIMWRLEAGSMYFHIGNYKECIEQLKIAEELIRSYDERALLSIRDAGSETGAALANMNVLPYRGYCRDRILLSFFKSLAYLGAGNESAFRAQLRRLRDEHKKVLEDYQKFFDAEKEEVDKSKAKNAEAVKKRNPDISPEALAQDSRNAVWAGELNHITQRAHKGYGNFLNPATIFLSGLGSVFDNNYENARIDFQRLYDAMPQNPMARKYYVSVLKKAGRPVPAVLKGEKAFDFSLDKNCVYVIFANGRSAAFRQISIYYPIMTAWPVMEFYPSAFNRIKITADAGTYCSFPLADMDGIMAQEFKGRLPGIITRVILSTTIKEVAYHAALAAARQITDSTARAIAMVAVSSAGTAYRIATNTADTRSWEILPKEFQLTQFPMPRNRTLSITLEGAVPRTESLRIPDGVKSAIIYVSAVNGNNIKYHLLPLGN